MKKELWAAAVNLVGCDDGPIRVKFDKETNLYCESSGEFGFLKDEKISRGRVVFSSEIKSEVVAFIAGANAVYHILDMISGNSE